MACLQNRGKIQLQPYRLQEATVGVEHGLTPTLSVAGRYVHKHLDRAVEDIGALDAEHNEIYAIGNPGFGRATTAHVFTDGSPVPFPRARRDYDALELSLNKRLSDGWALRTSYVWSRLWGNYSGLVHGDENGRLAPNWGRVFDKPIMMFDEKGEPVYGRLPTDRPHQIKAQFIYDARFGASVGLAAYVASGTPITRAVRFISGNNFPVQYLGRGSDGRTPTRSQLDLYLQHQVGLGGERRLLLLANVLNLFNQQATLNRFPWQLEDGASVDVTPEQFFGGIDTQDLIRDRAFSRLRASSATASSRPPREIRLGIRFLFSTPACRPSRFDPSRRGG